MSPKDMAFCVFFAAALPLGQVMFKWAALYNARQEGPLVTRLATNFPLMGALAWYGLTALFWFYILTRVPLSRAYPFALAGTGFVPILAWILFREPMTWRIGAGYALILAGLLVVQSQNA